MARGTIRERQLQLREEAVLDAAHQLLSEQGYADLNMDDLAARAGIAKATLYKHFPSKESLMAALAVRMMRASMAYLEQLDEGLPAAERLRRWLRSIVEGRIALPQGRIESSAAVRGNTECQYQSECLRAVVERLIDQAKAEGDITTEVPTAILVRLLPRCAHDSDFGDLLADGRYRPSDVGEYVVTLLFSGLAPRRA